MLSMTGYGMGSAELGNGKLFVEARGVNHRFLEIAVRFPDEVAEHALVADSVARGLLERGRIEITANLENAPGGPLLLQKDRAREAFSALRELRDELCPDQPVPLSLLAAVPGIFAAQRGLNVRHAHGAVQAATEEACQKLIEMRTREGALLAADLKQRVASVRGYVERIHGHFPNVVETLRRKLHARIERVVTESSLAINPSRIEQEIALLADRADVAEELTRLISHCDQFEGMILPSKNPIGRKMEFLLQEMGREVNTIGSKVPELEVTKLVLELKTELERMREQVQNVL